MIQLPITLPKHFTRAASYSLALAIVWWLAAFWLSTTNTTPVWHDQQYTFTQLGLHLDRLYSVPGFVNPPWTALFLALFSLVALPLATLLQAGLYFVLLTAVIFKFGGKTRTVLI